MLIGKLGTRTIKRTEIATAHLPEVLSDVFGTRRKSISLFFFCFFTITEKWATLLCNMFTDCRKGAIPSTQCQLVCFQHCNWAIRPSTHKWWSYKCGKWNNRTNRIRKYCRAQLFTAEARCTPSLQSEWQRARLKALTVCSLQGCMSWFR